MSALVAHANRHVRVKVLAALRPHPAEVQGVERADHVDRGLDVVMNDERHHRRDLELLGATARAGTGEPFRQGIGIETLVRAKQHRDPAVANLGRERDILGALGGEEHRDVLAQRVDRRL